MFSDRIWSQMQFTIKWSLVSLVFSEMPGPEWLHVRSLFFGHGDHNFLVCFDPRIVGLIAECAAVHLQWLEDAGNPVRKFKRNVWPWKNSLKAFFFSEEGFQVQNALSVFTVNDPTNSLLWILTCHCAQLSHTHIWGAYETHLSGTFT